MGCARMGEEGLGRGVVVMAVGALLMSWIVGNVNGRFSDHFSWVPGRLATIIVRGVRRHVIEELIDDHGLLLDNDWALGLVRGSPGTCFHGAAAVI